MKPKRRNRGLLTYMVKYSKGSSSARKASFARTIAMWVGGAVVVAFLVFFLFVIGVRTLVPTAGERVVEGDFSVWSVQENPPGYLPEQKVVAVAWVEIEKIGVAIPLTADRRHGVEKGKSVHVKYRFLPLMSTVTVDDWHVKP